MSVHLLVPTLAWMWTDAVLALWRLQTNLPPGSTTTFQTGTSSIPAARNALARVAMEGPHDYFLWVDADMLPQPDSATHLLRVAQRTKADIVSALCFTRVLPKFHVACHPMPGTEADASGVQDCEWVGFGCVLTHRRVFERVGQPWFEQAPDAKRVGEDVQLCRKARAKGLRVVVDWSHEVPHLGVLPVTASLVEANYEGRYPSPVR